MECRSSPGGEILSGHVAGKRGDRPSRRRWVPLGRLRPKVEDFFEVADPAIEFDISRTNPESQVYRGRDGMVEALEQWIGTLDAYELQALELIDAAPDPVVTVIRERGRLKGSDGWVEHTRGAVWTIEGQRIIRYEEHQNRAWALKAAGLWE
jgi:ketosteroid isomerase-like protein